MSPLPSQLPPDLDIVSEIDLRKAVARALVEGRSRAQIKRDQHITNHKIKKLEKERQLQVRAQALHEITQEEIQKLRADLFSKAPAAIDRMAEALDPDPEVRSAVSTTTVKASVEMLKMTGVAVPQKVQGEFLHGVLTPELLEEINKRRAHALKMCGEGPGAGVEEETIIDVEAKETEETEEAE